MQYFYEINLKSYETFSNQELLSQWRDNDDENARVVLAKRNHNLKGDVFLHKGFICNLKNHLEQNEDSTATTIEEAGAEFLANLEKEKSNN